MPRKPTPKPRARRDIASTNTMDALQVKMDELLRHPKVDGAIIVIVTDEGQRLSCWGCDTEHGGLKVMEGAAYQVQNAAAWLAQGGVRPGPETH